MMKYYSGTSGIQIPIPKRDFPSIISHYSRLTYYASLYNSIEINSSFYKIPQASTLIKWSNEVPGSFKFTFKLWQGITHNKGLLFSPGDVAEFIRVINHVGYKKGCLLVQLPPGLNSFAINQLQVLLSVIRQEDKNGDWKVAVEFRNKSWYEDSIFALLAKYETGLVIQDLPASASPITELDNGFVYLRFHGPNGGYRGSYTDAFLSEYATYIQEWLKDKKTVFAYFNNTMGDAINNLASLNSYIL